MRVRPSDVSTQLCRQGGEPFENFLYDLVVAEAAQHGIRPDQVEWDYRTWVGDGGRDILIRTGHSGEFPRFIPPAPSVWSAKSGDSGTDPGCLRTELRDHPGLITHLRSSGRYVWCAISPISQDGREKMREAADRAARDLFFNPALIEFRWVEALTTVVNFHPNLVGRHFPTTAQRLEGVITLQEWEARQPFGQSEWHSFSDRDDVIDRVRSHLLEMETPNLLHIGGISGTGKTRTVLQACLSTPCLTDTLYLPQAVCLSETALRELTAPGVCTRLVVDELPLHEVTSLQHRIACCQSSLRVISIGPVRRHTAPDNSGPSIIILQEPDTSEAVLPIIAGAGRGIPHQVLESIARVSAHDLRLALYLTWATLRNQTFHNTPVRDCDDIWNRITSLFGLQDAASFRDHYSTLTCALDVGRTGTGYGELDFLAEFFEQNVTQLDRTIRDANRYGLGLNTPGYFEPQPGALAQWLFRDDVWPILEPRLQEFITGLAGSSSRLFRRFLERCQEATPPVRTDVDHAVSNAMLEWVQPLRLPDLGERELSRIVQAWIELAPGQGLPWLVNLVRNASDLDIEALDGEPDGSGGWRGRRQIVWLCEHLACFAEWFYPCEEILFRLAQVETEDVGNNSTAVWRCLYWPVLSGTEVPFNDRLTLLLRRLRQATERTLPLVLSAATGLMVRYNSRLVPPQLVGGRFVPQEWRPETGSELSRCRQQAGRAILAAINELGDLRSLGTNAVVAQIHHFLSAGLATELRELLGGEDEPLRRIIRIKLERFLAQATRGGAASAYLEHIQNWRAALEPGDLVQRIRHLTCQYQWDVRRLPSSEEGNDEPDPYGVLAGELRETPAVLEELEDWLNDNLARSQRELASQLGQLPHEERIHATICRWMETAQCAVFVGGYLESMARRDGNLSEAIHSRLDQLTGVQPEYALAVTLDGDQSRAGLARIMRTLHAREGDRARWYGRLVLAPWPGIAGTEGQTAILDDLMQNPLEAAACWTAIRLLTFWSNHGRIPLADPLLSRAVGILQTEQATGEGEDYEWECLVRLCLSQALEQMIELLTQALTNLQANYFHRRERAAEMLRELGASHHSAVLESLGRRMVDTAHSVAFRIDQFPGLFEALPLTGVQGFIEERGEDAAVLVAKHVSSPQVAENGEPSIPPLTEWLLTRFEASDRVFRAFLEGRHTGIHSGHPRDGAAETQRQTEPFLQGYPRRLREWAEWERAELQDSIEWYDQHEDDFLRQ